MCPQSHSKSDQSIQCAFFVFILCEVCPENVPWLSYVYMPKKLGGIGVVLILFGKQFSICNKHRSVLEKDVYVYIHFM